MNCSWFLLISLTDISVRTVLLAFIDHSDGKSVTIESDVRKTFLNS